MKIKLLQIILLIGFIFTSCEKDNSNYETIIIKTGKNIYKMQEPIIVEIKNLTDSIAYYYRCGPAYLFCIPPTVLKYEDNTWTGLWGPICDCYTSHCCGELNPNEVYIDTITKYNISFAKGRFKLGYSFIIKHEEGYQSFFSNEFKIE